MTNLTIIKAAATTHNPGNYAGKVDVPRYPVYVPEAITEAPVNVPEMPVNVPEAEAPANTPEAPEKSIDDIIRETARKNAADFEARLLAEYITENRNILTYDNLPGLYRLQVRIEGKVKTVARIKAQKDVYILVREEVAQAINADYLLINYNLPAGFHTDYTQVFDWLEAICKATEDQTEAPTE